MKTIEVKVYSFNELSEEAKQVAIDNYRNKGFEYAWAQENVDSLLAFYKIFPLSQMGRNYTEFTFYERDEIENLSGWRLATYIWNNYGNQIFKGKYYGNLSTNEPVKHKRIKSSGPYKNGNRFHAYHSAITLEHSCVMTGFCMDDEILDPVYKFLDKPDNTTFGELMQYCINAWENAVEADEEWQNSDEYIAETLEANSYEFTQDGKEF